MKPDMASAFIITRAEMLAAWAYAAVNKRKTSPASFEKAIEGRSYSRKFLYIFSQGCNADNGVSLEVVNILERSQINKHWRLP